MTKHKMENEGNKEQSEELIKEETKEVKDKKSTTALFVTIAFIAGIILILVLVQFFYHPDQNTNYQEYTYHGFVFKHIGGMWVTEVQPKGWNKLFQIPLHFGPRELENVTIYGEINSSFDANETYITFDPDEAQLSYVALAAGELSLNLVQAMGIIPIAACTSNLTIGCESRPIINCSSDGSVIYIQQSNSTEIELRNNCIIIRGSGPDIVRATDRLILQWYKVMD